MELFSVVQIHMKSQINLTVLEKVIMPVELEISGDFQTYMPEHLASELLSFKEKTY